MQTSLLLEANSLAARRWSKQIHCCNVIRADSVATSSPPSHSQLHGRCYSIYRDSIDFHLQMSNKKGITATSPKLVNRYVKTRDFRPIRFLSSASSSFSSFSSFSSSPTSNDDLEGIHLSPTQTTLALSVHFKHPALGMKDFEILSRASAFLINVDPLSPENNRRADTPLQNTQDRESHVKDDPNNHSPSTIIPPDSNKNTNTNYPHLTQNQTLRQKLLHRQNYAYEPAGGPRRFPHQLNWLEFCPDAFRPKVHVVASSHVLSPWLWPKYYGQDWLRVLKDESDGGAGGEGFVRYSLEVWGDAAASGGGRDGNDGGGWIGHDGKLEGVYKPLAKFALNPYPIHHPQGMDVAVIHLKQEDTALKHLTSLGIHPLNLPTMHEFQSSTDPVFHPDERVLFQGYEVYEANMADEQELPSSDNTTTNQQKQHQNKSSSEEDERTFHPYSSLGNISMASPDRFLAKTQGGPLPEGLCGGPVIQLTDPKTGEDIPLTTANASEKKHKIIKPLNLRGVVEGIVPINHEDSRLAGLASFLPSYRIREFVDFAERVMLQQIVPEELFERVVALKKQESVKNTVYRGGSGNELREEGKYDVDASDDGKGRLSGEQVKEDDDGASPKNPFVEGFGESEHTPELDREYQEILASLSQNHSREEVDAILATVEAERKEVIEIIEREGGDLDDVIARVRKQTYERKDKILEELQKEIEQGMWRQRGSVQEGEIVSSKDDDHKK